MSNVRRSLLLIGLPVLAVLLWLMWYQPQQIEADTTSLANNPVPVHIAKVIEQDIPLRVQGLGQVQAWHTVTVRTRIDGRLDKVYFQEGEDVKQGQLLIELDNRVQVANLEAAKAQKAKNQVLLNNANQDLQRYQQLAKHMAIEKQALDAQKAQVASLQASLLADEASISLAKTELDFTKIVAPIDGRTGELLVDAGNQIRANDTTGIVIIKQIDPIAVSFTVPDTVFTQVHNAANNESALVQVLDRSEQALLAEGQLVLLDNQIDPASATLRLKAKFSNQDHKLWPGLSVDVRLILGSIENALVVPEDAVQRGAQGLYVYVVEPDSTVSMQPVETMLFQDGLAIILNGLQAGQSVVVDGQYKLRPGMAVAEAL